MTRTVAIYVIVQCLVAAVDSVTCAFKLPFPLLGRIVTPSTLCRPHVWYQEPNYLASFLLFAYLTLRTVIESGFDRSARKLYWVAIAAAGLGVLLSTSRMGWVALAGALAVEILFPLKTKRLEKLVALGVLVTLLLGLRFLPLPNTWHHTLHTFASIRTDISLAERFQAGSAALGVFRQSPLIGAGPGGSGAFAVDQAPPHSYIEHLLETRSRDSIRSDPMSKDLFTEILAEWGLAGLIFFVSGLILRLWPLPGKSRLVAAWIILLVYGCSQTLQRFDLWTCLGLIFALAAWHRARDAREPR